MYKHNTVNYIIHSFRCTQLSFYSHTLLVDRVYSAYLVIYIHTLFMGKGGSEGVREGGREGRGGREERREGGVELSQRLL